jgi:hypothetical protein
MILASLAKRLPRVRWVDLPGHTVDVSGDEGGATHPASVPSLSGRASGVAE